MYTSSVIARGKAALQGDDTEKQLTELLFDDLVQVASSFEMNQIASLTYHETSVSGDDLCDKIFDILEAILKAPASHSPLTLQKSLAVTKHLLIFGAEKVIQESKRLGRHVEALQSYNTVLLAQQQQGASGMLLRLKGGGVDKGGPVREVAQQVHVLLSNPQHLAFERATQADPNSLVPVGDDRVAFVTDEVRLYALKKRIEEQHRINLKSNLAKADSSFGGGYMSKDGKSVVGAAHGMEEMLKMAAKEKQHYSDVAKQNQQKGEGFSDYAPPDADLLSSAASSTPQQQHQPTMDLLSLDDQHPPTTTSVETDLLGFSSDIMGGSSSQQQQSSDIFAPSNHPAEEPDLLTAAAPAPVAVTSADLLSMMSLNGASATSASASAPTQSDSFVPVVSSDSPAISATSAKKQQPIMMQSSNHEQDPFAALGSATTDSSSLMKSSLPSNNNTQTGLDSLSGLAMGQSQIPTTTTTTTTQSFSLAPLKVSDKMTPPRNWGGDDNDDSENGGFVMGGATGTGLEPIGSAPTAPPPPPPPGL